MNSSWRRIIVGAMFFGVTFLVAVAGYMLAGWNLLDSIYMVVITVFGVGYGETRPLDTPAMKVFTMGVIIAGCSSGIYVVGGIVTMLAEGEVKRALGFRRMSKGIEQLSSHAIICGYGRVGQIIVAELTKAKHQFVVVDNSDSRTQEAQAAGHLTVLGSASEEATLVAAGIARAKVLATVLPDDTANVFITLTARELNPTIEIIARAESPSTEKKLIRSGANRVVLPALIGATKIGQLILRPSAEDLLADASGNKYLNDELQQIGLEMTEIELRGGSPLIGQNVGSIDIGGGFVLIGVKKSDGAFVRNPPTEMVMNLGDKFIILGHRDTLPSLVRRAKPRQVSFRGATG